MPSKMKFKLGYSLADKGRVCCGIWKVLHAKVNDRTERYFNYHDNLYKYCLLVEHTRLGRTYLHSR